MMEIIDSTALAFVKVRTRRTDSVEPA